MAVQLRWLLDDEIDSQIDDRTNVGMAHHLLAGARARVRACARARHLGAEPGDTRRTVGLHAEHRHLNSDLVDM